MTPTSFEAASLGVAKLKVHDLDGTDTEYTLVLDFNALAKIQDATGRDLSEPKGWEKMTGPELPVIAHGAMLRFHPEVTLEQVRGMLSPAQTGPLFNLLLTLCFPGILDAKPAGENQPNPPEQ